ncbi:DUF2285 domain-containing protein [Stakelama tenebrarum]|uniref:DUF2285 domain-containing protein n=1 Tax=Stakelama tenebrarum TaxID=2711215 RepID=A0A6G6Y192_9SPHN|nr:DUF2285 domain-containing protein [Sphingosinithalassobacter tenebrarum]QIG78577.1 DUF2285 domain-containing protein [Sphingosinithalassobacter tenebrarum]
MPPEKDWRAPPDEAGDEALQYCDIAIGYVSRNSRYHLDYRRALDRVRRGVISADAATAGLVQRWGVSYHAAPTSAFDRKLAVARPDLAPDSIILAPCLDGIGAAPRLDMAMLGAVRARMKIGDFLHFILADTEGDEHVWVAGALDVPMAMMVPVGINPLARLAAAERLCRRLSGMASGPPALRPPPFRREHLLTLLQVLDGQRAGATQRELAASLIHRRVRRYTTAEWVESPERKRIRRWLKEAVELRDGGYIRLLRGD